MAFGIPPKPALSFTRRKPLKTHRAEIQRKVVMTSQGTKSRTKLHVHSPLVHSAVLSTSSQNILLKLDSVQPGGSFKIRGHGHLASVAKERGVKHLICSSGGNAGAAVAHAGAQLGLAVTIVVPESTPTFMIERLRQVDADVIVHGTVWDVADAKARELASQGGLHVSPFDDPLLWDGHGSLVDELVQDLEGRKPSAVVVSVGGGGLFLGVAEGLRRVGWEDVPIVTAETEGAESFARMAEAGRVVTLKEISSIAKSLGALAVSERCVQWVQERQVIPVVVSDCAAVEAVSILATQHRVLVEPACGAAIAALQDEKVKALGGDVVVVVCGGNMVSPSLLRQWIETTGAKEAAL